MVWKENGAVDNNVKVFYLFIFFIIDTVLLVNAMGWLKPLVGVTIEKRMS